MTKVHSNKQNYLWALLGTTVRNKGDPWLCTRHGARPLVAFVTLAHLHSNLSFADETTEASRTWTNTPWLIYQVIKLQNQHTMMPDIRLLTAYLSLTNREFRKNRHPLVEYWDPSTSINRGRRDDQSPCYLEGMKSPSPSVSAQSFPCLP